MWDGPSGDKPLLKLSQIDCKRLQAQGKVLPFELTFRVKDVKNYLMPRLDARGKIVGVILHPS